MSKYINAEELKDKITEDFGLKNEMSCFDIAATIMDFPSADVVEVKHGHWELDGTCSVCKKHTLQSHGNFCCYCGADMRGKTE